MSSTAPMGMNGRTQCSQVAACPWTESPPGLRLRTEEEALQRRIEGAQTPSHGQAGPAGAALLWIQGHLREPSSVVHPDCLHPDHQSAQCRARNTMPLQRGDGPEHARARCRAQQATVQGLVPGAVVESHAAHAAALHQPVSSARAFLSEAALPAVRALSQAGAFTLLRAMDRVVNAVCRGLVDPEVAL